MATERTDAQVYLQPERQADLTSEDAFRWILVNEGIVDEEVLAETPRRWINALKDALACDCDAWKFTTFESDSDEMVIVKNIDFTTLCAHHLLPFFWRAHVAYIPQGKVAGLSKLARSVRTACKGLWSQEELTRRIADELEEVLGPMGVAVVLEAEHTCMTTRGVRAPDSKTTTSAMLGVFRDNTNNARAEFLSLMR